MKKNQKKARKNIRKQILKKYNKQPNEFYKMKNSNKIILEKLIERIEFDKEKI